MQKLVLRGSFYIFVV